MSDTISVNLLLFAKARELVGASSVSLSVTSSTSTHSELLEQILSQFPVLSRLGDSFVLSLNEQYIDHESEFQLR